MNDPLPVPPLLIPNVAAEEGAVWEASGGESAARAVARLWRLLFGSAAEMLGDPETFGALWPAALGAPPHHPVFPELEAGNAFAWLHTREARELAKSRGYVLASPSPEAVDRVHDKAFALRGAEALGVEPAALRGLARVLEPDALREAPGAVLETIRTTVDVWPGWVGGRFTLKPRFGSSGRGRVSGAHKLGSRGGDDALLGAFPRLAERGGAIFEPWLDRVRDLSAQLWIEPGGRVRLLGTLELLVTPAGLYRGHRGSVDNKGRVTSLCPEDEPLREAAAELAVRAAAEGFVGPCGVDAFSFRGPEGEHVFRPLVECNGRFTMGTIAVGLLRRALPMLRAALPRDASERRVFRFALAPPPAGWPVAPGPECLSLLFGPAASGPGFLVASDEGHLETAFQGAGATSILTH